MYRACAFALLIALALFGCMGYPPAYEPLGFLELDSKLLVALEPREEGAFLRLVTEKSYACEMIEIIVEPSRADDTIVLDVKGLNNSICAPAYGRASWPLNVEPLPENLKEFVLLEPGEHHLFLRHKGNEDEYLLRVGNNASIQEIRTTFSSAMR